MATPADQHAALAELHATLRAPAPAGTALYVHGGGHGFAHPVTAGVIDDNVEFIFTHGWCWALACVLAWQLDGEVVVAGSDAEDWGHALARLDDGTLIDIRGRATEADVLQRWNERRVRPLSGDEIRALADPTHPDGQRADIALNVAATFTETLTGTQPA